MGTVIEVGANYGTDTRNFLAQGHKVYAFEPTPELVLHLQQSFKNNPNFHLVPMAASDKTGWAQFNIAGGGDWGCSSLYEFTPDIHEKWAGRPDFQMTDRVTVMTIRLDQFMDLYSVDEQIDYLWIDAQGHDFNVLKSLGDRIGQVNAGKCEGSYTVDLYSGTENSVPEISMWLNDNGFATRIVPDNVGKEADVHFVRRKV